MRNENLTTFYIARHGQTESNVESRIQGQLDSPLTDLGVQQAQDLAQSLKGIKFDLVFSSDLMRAKRTAEIVAKEHDLVVEATELIRERTFGKFEGQLANVLREYDEYFESLTEAEKFKYRFEGDVESDEEIAIRLSRFIRETAISHPGKTVLAVAHGGIMRAMLLQLGYGTYQTLGRFKNTAFFVLQSDGSDMFLKEVTGIDLLEKKAV